MAGFARVAGMKLCLAIIVGNEEAVIARFLESFKPIISSLAVVYNTGTAEPDKTREEIKYFCDKYDVRFFEAYYDSTDFLHTDNFGKARQMAWDLAFESGEPFVMWADADDLLPEETAQAILSDPGEHDIYVLPYRVQHNDDQIVYRERIVRNDGRSRWKYCIHEQLEFTKDSKAKLMHGARILHSPLGEKRSSHERNLNILHKATEDAGRNFYYLQEQYFHSNPKECQRYAAAALTCPDLSEVERYGVYLNLAQLENSPKAKEWASMALVTQSDRREALALLASYALVEKRWIDAHALATMMVSIGKPALTYWNLNHAWYGWKGRFLYAQTLRGIGKHEEAHELELDAFIKEGSRFSVIHATYKRPAEALAIRDMWFSRADNPDAVEYIFGLHSFDEKSIPLKTYKHSICEHEGGAKNYAAAAAISNGHVLIQAQDDVYPPQGWDTALWNKLAGRKDEPWFIATSDGSRKDKLVITSIMTRPLMREWGHFICPEYKSIYVDNENTYRAYKSGRVIEARDLVFYHDHPFFNPNKPWDETYAIENSKENYEGDGAIFARRNPEAATDGIL
jgi:hypothetical protein